MVELVAGLIDVFADAPLTGNPLAVVRPLQLAPQLNVYRLAARLSPETGSAKPAEPLKRRSLRRIGSGKSA